MAKLYLMRSNIVKSESSSLRSSGGLVNNFVNPRYRVLPYLLLFFICQSRSENVLPITTVFRRKTICWIACVNVEKENLHLDLFSSDDSLPDRISTSQCPTFD